MIIKLLLPARLGKYRLYKERFVGLSIDGQTLYAAVVTIGLRKTVIEKLYKENLGDMDDVDHVRSVIDRFIKTVKSVDTVRIVVPSSIVIFKELQLPFIDLEKISFVLPYEVEPLIPFSLDKAAISFVVNEKKSTTQVSKVFIAAAQVVDIERHLSLYGLSIEPDVLTTDIITTNSIFHQIPSYVSRVGLHCFINIYERTTRIILCTEKGIKITKNIYRGVGSIAETFAERVGFSYDDAMIKVMEGFKSESLDPFLEKEWIQFVSEIQLAMNALLLQHEQGGHVAETWCAGSYAHIPGLAIFFSTYLNIECRLFEPEKITETKKIVYQGESIGSWTPFTNALGAALVLENQEHFSLSGTLLQQKREKLLFHLWGTALAIMLTILLVVGGHSFYYLRDLQGTLDRLEQKEVQLLHPLLQANNKKKASRALTLKRAQSMAEEVLKSKENSWQELQKNSITPLEIWYELTKLFDKNRFDVKIEMITMSREDGPLKIDVSGVFRSKTGSDHFTHFADFEKRFSDARLLALDGLNESLTDDGSVQFNTLFKIREI